MIVFLGIPLLMVLFYIGVARATAALALVCIGPALFPGAFFGGVADGTAAAGLAQLPWTALALFTGCTAALALGLEWMGIQSRVLSGFRTR